MRSRFCAGVPIVALAMGAAFHLVERAAAQDSPTAATPIFNGSDLKGWKFRGGPKASARSKWALAADVYLLKDRFGLEAGEGVLVNRDDGRGVDLISALEHGDCELHIEFNVARGSNSGVYLQGQYEVQILDSHGKKAEELKYGDCGGIYNTAPPRLNASLPPGKWQSFDIVFQAPRFDAAGKKVANARFLKVLHNDKVIHENVEVKGPTTASLGGPERLRGPLMLQGDHGPVAFRNIRLRLLENK